MPKMKCPTCESDDPFFDHYEDGSKLARDLISPAHLCPDPFHSPEADKGTERAGERWAVRAMQLEDMLRFQRERAERAEAALQEAREAVRRHEADKGAERWWVYRGPSDSSGTPITGYIGPPPDPENPHEWIEVVPAFPEADKGSEEWAEARVEASRRKREADEYRAAVLREDVGRLPEADKGAPLTELPNEIFDRGTEGPDPEADKGAEQDQWVRVSQIRFGERPDGSRNWMRVVPASQLQGVTGDYERSEARLAEVSSQLQEAREALRNCLADLEQAVAWLHPEEAGSFNLDRHRKALTDTEKPDD